MLVVLASSARDNVLDQGFSTQPLVDTPSLLHAPQDLMSFKWACTNGHDEQGEAVTSGCGVVSYVNRCSFLRTAFACIFAHYNTFKGIFAHFLRAAF